MLCPKCGHEFKSPVAQAGGRAGGAARVAKGFAVCGQPDAAARTRAWKTRKASMTKDEMEQVYGVGA